MPTQKDAILGKLAVERGYLTQNQVDEGIEIQRKMRDDMAIDQSLDQILVGKGWLTADQAQELRTTAAVETGEARLVAGYEAISKLGQGGMGAVYRARRLGTEDFVALKILPPSLADEQMIARFRRESEIVRKLHHGNIVDCLEFGFDKRRKCYFCALELVEGEDLRKRIARLGKLAEGEAVSIATQIAGALQHAFFNGLVHRDVKPENIMVTPDGTAKLLDLGLARPANQEATRLTESGLFVGSPYYASPEQALGEQQVDIRSDIYSLGATLYHMVTGRPPFEGTTALAILQKHVTEKLPWPAEANPELSDGLCRIIAKMMEKAPEHRYQTPNDLHRDLDLLIEGKEPEVEDAALTNSSVSVPSLRRRRRGRPAARSRRPGRPRGETSLRDDGRPQEPEAGAGKPYRSLTNMAMVGGVVALMVVIGLVLLLGGRKTGRTSAKPEQQKGKPQPAVQAPPGELRERGEPRRKIGGGHQPRPAPRRADQPRPSVHPGGNPTNRPLTAAAALRGADDYETANPGDPAGAIARYEAVVRDSPDTIEGRKARMNLMRLRRPADPAGPPAVTSAVVSGEDFVWWEAESPAESTFPARTWLSDERRCAEVLSGGKWLTYTTDDQSGPAPFAKYRVRVPADGVYSFWARKFWKHGPFRWRFDDGAWQTCTKGIAIADSVQLRKTICANWVSLGSATLTRGPHELEVRLAIDEGEKGVAAFDCFLLTKGTFTPRGKLRPRPSEGRPVPAPTASAGAGQDAGWRPIFDGRTAGFLMSSYRKTWQVRDGALLGPSGRTAFFLSWKTFADGEIRMRFELTKLARLLLGVRNADNDGWHITLERPAADALQGATHEARFTMSGDDVWATLDGRPVKLGTKNRPRKGWIAVKQTPYDDGRLRMLAIDYRELKPAAPTAVAEDAPEAPGKLASALAGFDDLIAEGNYDGARRSVERAARERGNAAVAEALRAAARVARELEARRKAIRGAVRSLAGSAIELRTSRGKVAGKAQDVTDEAIVLMIRETLRGAGAVETLMKVRWADLAPGQEDELAQKGGWRPEDADGRLAWAYLALGRGDADPAERELGKAKGHPLAKHFMERIDALRLARAEDNPLAAWRTIERWAGRPAMSVEQAKALLRIIDAHEQGHRGGELPASRRKGLATARGLAGRTLIGAGLVPGAVEFAGHRYKLYRYPMPWDEAKGFCERLGAHLVTITSREKNEFAAGLARAADASVWIGFTDERDEGSWEWVTGEAPAFAGWQPGRPLRKRGVDHCRMHAPWDWKWEDKQGDPLNFFVCEWEPPRRIRPPPPSRTEDPFEIPPGSRKILLYREDFEKGLGGWGGSVVADTQGAGRVLRLKKTPGAKYTSASTECQLGKGAFEATLKTRFRFKYRIEGGLTTPSSQHWFVSPAGKGANHYLPLPASRAWAWVDFAAEQLRPNVGEEKAPDLAGGFTVTALKMPCGPPDRTGECFIDDFEVYDVVP